MAGNMNQDTMSEDLTNEEIDELLKQAEDRLRKTSTTAGSSPLNAQSSRPQTRLEIPNLPKPYIDTSGEIALADPQRLVAERTKRAANGIRKIEDPLITRRKELEAKKATAGASWYNLPRTDLTPELKRDLALIRMRSVLDPKRFYKKENAKAPPPEFSQVATVVEGPTDFFSGRISKKARKRTIAEEVMATEMETGKLKRQYNELQAKKTSGKKGDYKRRMQRRYGKRLRT